MPRTVRLLTPVFVAIFASLAVAAEGQTKNGVIKSVDEKAKTITVTVARDLVITTDDKTTFTLDGKASTFADAAKAECKVTVTYVKSGENRLASKIEVTSKGK